MTNSTNSETIYVVAAHVAWHFGHIIINYLKATGICICRQNIVEYGVFDP